MHPEKVLKIAFINDEGTDLLIKRRPTEAVVLYVLSECVDTG